MSYGPTLDLAVLDRERTTTDVVDALRAVVERDRATTVEAGPDPGSATVTVWAGDLGLGVPEDDDRAWLSLTRRLAEVVRTVRPALALCGVEWAVSSWDHPDFAEWLPGLASGWVRREGAPADRADRFTRLGERGVVQSAEGYWAWGSLADEIGLGAPENSEAAVFHAWSGRLPEEVEAEPALLWFSGATVESLVNALPDGYRIEASAGLVQAVAPTWARYATPILSHLVDAATLTEATWCGVALDPSAPPGDLVAVWTRDERLRDELERLMPEAQLREADDGWLWTGSDSDRRTSVQTSLPGLAATAPVSTRHSATRLLLDH